MKKLAAITLALLFVLSFTSCKNDGTGDDTSADTGDTSYTIETTATPETTTEAVETTTAPTDTTALVTTAPETTAPAEITFTSADMTIYVTGENVWVRSAPSTDGTGIATLHYGDDVKCVGVSDDWYKIIYADKECYISAHYVTTDNITANDFEAINDTVYVSVDVVSLRVGPSTDTEIKAYLSKGTALTRIGRNENWSKVTYEGGTYYVHNSCVSTDPVTATTTAS